GDPILTTVANSGLDVAPRGAPARHCLSLVVPLSSVATHPSASRNFHPTHKHGYTRGMEQEPDFDLDHFEQRVDSLLSAYRQLQDDHRRLQAANQVQAERNSELRERLNSVIERIRALETEADSV